MRQVGIRMTELMIRYGLTANGLANKTGLAKNSIRNWADGHTDPRLSNFIVVCKGIGVTLDEFCDWVDFGMYEDTPGISKEPEDSLKEELHQMTDRLVDNDAGMLLKDLLIRILAGMR